MPQQVVDAVQAAIVASAHMAAYEHVAAAAQACRRLGGLTSGRWRAAGRDLGKLEQELQVAYARAAEAVAGHAEEIGVPEEALWTTGDAAATLDLLREDALAEAPPDSPAARLLQGKVLFGVSFVEDPELPDRGTTLLFGWPAPLAPATWPWQATWVVGDGQEDGADEDELDLYDAGELEAEDRLLADLVDELSCSRQEAREALHEAAVALTRASLLAAVADDEDDEDEPEDGEDVLT